MKAEDPNRFSFSFELQEKVGSWSLQDVPFTMLKNKFSRVYAAPPEERLKPVYHTTPSKYETLNQDFLSLCLLLPFVMDHQQKMASVSSEYEQDEGSKLGAEFSSTLDDDLYSSFQRTAMEVDVSLEWLSAFVEECLSAKGSSLQLQPPPQLSTTHLNNPSTPPNSLSQPTLPSPFFHFAAVPSKARSKRRRSLPNSSIHPHVGRCLRQLNLLQNKHSLQLTSSSTDPPLLQQTYWLADSELLLPHKAREGRGEREKTVDMDRKGRIEKKSLQMQQQQKGGGSGRRCSHCQAQRTPQWRGGPLGPKTLCNACGVRYKKSGGLVPEYRPANSPTFVSLLHSNSHKRVMEMRMINASSPSTAFRSSSP